MGLSDSRPGPPLGYVFPRAVGVVSFPALPGLPGSSTDLSLRAVPYHPGRSGECLLIASSSISGFILFGRLATSTLRNEAESGSLALRLAGLLPRFPPSGLRRLAPVPLHVRTSNLHGEYLSIHKISQAWPGVPKAQRNAKNKNPFFFAFLCAFAPLREYAFDLVQFSEAAFAEPAYNPLKSSLKVACGWSRKLTS